MRKKDNHDPFEKSGFGESRLTADNTLFNDGNVWVSFDQFVTSGKFYPINRIDSAEVVKGPVVSKDSIAVFVAGWLLLPFQAYLGLAVLAGTVLFWIGRKPYFMLVLTVRGKKIRALKSTDGKFLTKVYEAIVDALEMLHKR